MVDVPRVGLVLISHSRSLAEGAAELANQMSGDGVPVVAVGGTADLRLGTDPDQLAKAVIAASRGAGVVVIPDLGSSVLAARAYLTSDESLPDDVRIADAPFVEGAVAAVVAASTGAALDVVVTAAEEARHARKL